MSNDEIVYVVHIGWPGCLPEASWPFDNEADALQAALDEANDYREAGMEVTGDNGAEGFEVENGITITVEAVPYDEAKELLDDEG